MVRNCLDEKFYAIVLRHSVPDSDGKADVYEIAATKIQEGNEICSIHMIINETAAFSDSNMYTEHTDIPLLRVNAQTAVKKLANFMPDALDRRTPLLCMSRTERIILHHFLRDNGNDDCPEYIDFAEKCTEWFGNEQHTGDKQQDKEKSVIGELKDLTQRFQQLLMRRMNKSADVYDCMRSEEIRGFYRNRWILDTDEKISLIWHSMLPIHEKLELYQEIKAEATGENTEILRLATDVITDFLDKAEHPKRRMLYAMERRSSPKGMMKDGEMRLMISDKYNHLNCTDTVCTDLVFKDTIDEVIAEVNEQIAWNQKQGNARKHELYYVYQMIVPEKEPSKAAFEFYVMDIDRKAEITQLFPGDDYCREKLTNARFESALDDSFHQNIDLPYESGEILKLQTPLMEKPAYGYLRKEWALGWYNHLYCEEGDADSDDKDKNIRFLSLSYIFPDLAPYTLFDCIERASEEKIRRIKE